MNDEEGQLAVFFEDISPNDIKQGSISNCYFLSAVSVLAEFPDRIKTVIKTHEVNDEGVWSV